MDKKRLWSLVALLVVMLGAPAIVIWRGARTYHFESVIDHVLYRSGNRSVSEFGNGVRKEHVKTVVSLIDDGELNDPSKPQFKEEADWLAKNGVKQERIAVKLGGWPSGDDVKRFLAIVADPTKRPVLVHCAQGVRRTGMFVAAYEESVLGFDKAKAKDAVEAFGHSERVADDIKAFIDDYDPATMSMATTRPVTANE
jgi:protein tyrosine phosphatase (PTP) superfamily phosphohydrolase (DUF442 family)